MLKAFGVVLGDSALHHFPALRHMLGNAPGGVEIALGQVGRGQFLVGDFIVDFHFVPRYL